MKKNRACFYVNIAVFLFGMAGLFAKWIGLTSIGITFGRVFFSSLTLLFYVVLTKQSLKIENKKHLALLVFSGGVLALHWWTFLESIQLSTVAIGTITFSTFPMFLTFLEPVVFRKKLQTKDVIVAALLIVGVVITIPEISLENQMFLGVLVGLLSAFSYAVLTLANKVLTEKYASITVTFYEQGTAAVFLLPSLFFVKMRPNGVDIALLLFLGVVTTAFAHTIFVSSLKKLPARLAGVCSSMETVYSILLAALVLREIPGLRELLGAIVITGVVIWSQLKFQNTEEEPKVSGEKILQIEEK